MVDQRLDDLDLLQKKTIGVTFTWLAILLFLSIVGYEVSVIGFLSEQLRIHLFAAIFGMVSGLLAADWYFSKSRSRSLEIEKLGMGLIVGSLSLVIMLVTILNTEISSMLLVYTGIWFSVASLKIES